MKLPEGMEALIRRREASLQPEARRQPEDLRQPET